MLLAAALLAICASGPRVSCVVDGDTFWHQGEKMRLSGIDAPELFSPKCPAERALATRSRDRLREMLAEGFEIEREGQDRYRRTLAVVTVNGRSVGDQLVREGLARTWSGRREPWC